MRACVGGGEEGCVLVLGEGCEGCVLVLAEGVRVQVCVVKMTVFCSGGVSSSSCKLVNARWSGGGGA